MNIEIITHSWKLFSKSKPRYLLTLNVCTSPKKMKVLIICYFQVSCPFMDRHQIQNSKLETCPIIIFELMKICYCRYCFRLYWRTGSMANFDNVGTTHSCHSRKWLLRRGLHTAEGRDIETCFASQYEIQYCSIVQSLKWNISSCRRKTPHVTSPANLFNQNKTYASKVK